MGIAHHITCNFASEFSINFLYIDAYDNSLPGWSSHAEFGNTFADFFMNQIAIIRSQFKQSSFTHCHHRSVQMSFSVDPSVIKNTLEILNSMKKTTCHVYLCKIHFFMVIHRSCTENMDTDTAEITIQWFLSPVMEKAVIRLLITSCELYREFKNYPPISNLIFHLQMHCKGSPPSTLNILCRSKPIVYLVECLVQTPLNRNSGIPYMWCNPRKCWM